jgi:hypothetical protein
MTLNVGGPCEFLPTADVPHPRDPDATLGWREPEGASGAAFLTMLRHRLGVKPPTYNL